MRILLLSTYFQPDIASTGVLMTWLAEELTRLGHHLTIVTSMPHYSDNYIWPTYRGKLCVREARNRVKVWRVYLYVPRRKGSILGRVFNYASFNTLSALAGVLAGQHDIVLTPSPPLTNGIVAFLVSRLRGIPYVYNVQDIYPDAAIRLGTLTNPRIIAAFKAMERFIYSKAAAISVIGEGFRRNLLDKGVPVDKIKVIPNFADVDFIRPRHRHNHFSAEHRLDDKFVILFAGNVGLSQGLETVLDTAKRLKSHEDILFLIVGNGAAKSALQNQAEDLKLENVRFLPFQPYEALPAMYASSDVCLVPLRKGATAESVPCKVFTITAAGRPLIASVDEGGDTRRFVDEAECGLCVEPENADALAEAILTLHADADLRRQLGHNGRRYVEKHHTPCAVARQYAALLERASTKVQI